jgi:hypothetical protein
MPVHGLHSRAIRDWRASLNHTARCNAVTSQYNGNCCTRPIPMATRLYAGYVTFTAAVVLLAWPAAFFAVTLQLIILF